MHGTVQAGTAEAQTISAAELSTAHEVLEHDGRRRRARKVCEVSHVDGRVLALVRASGGFQRRSYESGESVLVRSAHAAEVERVRASLLDLCGEGRRS